MTTDSTLTTARAMTAGLRSLREHAPATLAADTAAGFAYRFLR
jgi:hypothetical protein